MDVLVRGMKMPNTCEECEFASWSNLCQTSWCDRKHKPTGKDFSQDYKVKRAKWCPLVPVPSHGRLIDADKLRDVQQADADFFKGSNDYGEKSRYDEAINAVANIINAPTIIEASERNDENEDFKRGMRQSVCG